MKNSPFAQWLKEHEKRVEPLEQELNLAHWDLATTGKKEFEDVVARLRSQYRKIYADKETFQKLSQWRKQKETNDPLLARQMESLWQAYASNQFSPDLIDEISKLESEVEGIYNNFRGTIDGKAIDNNAIRKTLREENSNEVRQKAWLASKQIGPKVEKLVLHLVALRNQGAKQCGFDNYYRMSLELDELSETKLFSLLERLADKTEKPFLEAKGKLDQELSVRFHTPVAALRPWHYADPFFQEAPPTKSFDLDFAYQDKDIVDLTRKTFASVGMDIEGILAKSDLFPREGKDQHAFCTMIGRSRDVRVLCNLEKNDYWMSTMLHEFGHAVYDWYLDENLPFFLHSPAHILSTEAIAMLFGRWTKNPQWLEGFLKLSPDKVQSLVKESQNQQALGMLVFVRWVLVMCHFERGLYENPQQDLNTLWWHLVEKYQHIKLEKKRNEPDWVTKNHIALAPVYYQNYLLGELIASQLEHHLATHVSKWGGLVNNPSVGKYLIEEYFKPGSSLRWDHHLEKSTGETLNPDYFVKQFVG